MEEFVNVTVKRSANIYFDGRVTSRTILFPDGRRKTLGVMLPGEYHFTTGVPEQMEIQEGELEVLLPGGSEWRTVRGGESFLVPGNAGFTMRVRVPTDYCCSFLEG
jgi:hypothetical protein